MAVNAGSTCLFSLIFATTKNYMSTSLFIAITEPYSGKSVVTLGVVNMLLGKAKKIGYFKPVINHELPDNKDNHIETVLQHFNLPIGYNDAFAYTRNDALALLQNRGEGEMIDRIIDKYKRLEEQFDFIVIEGTDYVGEGLAFEFELNATIARNLRAPVVIVVSGNNKSTAQLVNAVLTDYQQFRDREMEVLAVVANRVQPEQAADVRELLATQLPPEMVLAVIPNDTNLKSPTMKEIHEQLGGKLLFGEAQLSNQVDNFVTGAMQVPNFLNYMKENMLIVTPGDRGDIIICALQANLSTSYPKVAGIVLSAGSEPEEPVMRLIESSSSIIPIIAVTTGTFETTARLNAVQSAIAPGNKNKIELAINTFEKYIDEEALMEKMAAYEAEGTTPYMFQYQLTKRARRDIKHIVLPEGNEERILRAAARLTDRQIVTLTLLGDPVAISSTVKRLGISLDLNKVNIINPAASEHYDDYVQTLYALRKSKNVELEMARDLMTDVSYFGTMMVYKGHADGMVSGAIHTTQHTIRPALQFVKTKPGTSVVSSVFFMCLPDRVSVFGDCAVNPNPTAEQLAEIAISSAESSSMFGIEPRIAMLSYSSGTSGEGEDVEKVRKATELVKQKRPDLKIEGPIQYDAAVDPIVGSQKLPNSTVAGKASVLIFPDLNTGNNTYKAVQRETGALAIGPMLQGLNKPVNDLSRGCTVDDVFNTVIITAIQAQQA
jgi:phosphate acetyltransferase